MPARKKWRGGRAMLNKKGYQSTAAIVAEIEDTSDWPYGYDGEGEKIGKQSWRVRPDYTLQISNCDRSISFELGWDDELGSYANDLYKLDKMIDLLSDFRDALYDEQQRHKERMRLVRQARE